MNDTKTTNEMKKSETNECACWLLINVLTTELCEFGASQCDSLDAKKKTHSTVIVYGRHT